MALPPLVIAAIAALGIGGMATATVVVLRTSGPIAQTAEEGATPTSETAGTTQCGSWC